MHTLFYFVNTNIALAFHLSALFVVIYAIIQYSLRKHTKVIKFANLLLLFIIVCFVLYITIFKRVAGQYETVLLPFAFLRDGNIVPALMNSILFLPIGVFLPYVLNSSVKVALPVTALTSVFLSIFIEIAQRYFSLGRFETDDVIMNVLGGLMGAVSYIIFMKLNRRKESKGC